MQVFQNTWWNIIFPGNLSNFSNWRDCTGALQNKTALHQELPESVEYFHIIPEPLISQFEHIAKVATKLGATTVEIVEEHPEFLTRFLQKGNKIIRVLFDKPEGNIFPIILCHLVTRRLVFATEYLIQEEKKQEGFIKELFKNAENFRSKLNTPLSYYIGTLNQFASYRGGSYFLPNPVNGYYKTWTGVKNGLLARDPSAEYAHYFSTFFDKR